MNRSSSRLHRHHWLLLPLIIPSLLCASCAEISEANETFYDKVFESSRQRRIAKDTANLKAGRPLQYYRSPRDLQNARRTGRD